MLVADFSEFSILVVPVVVSILTAAGNAVFGNNVVGRVWKCDSVSRSEDAVIICLSTVLISEDTKIDLLMVGGAFGSDIVLSVLVSGLNLCTLEVFL